MSQRLEDLAHLLIVLAEPRTDVEFHLVESLLQLPTGASDFDLLDQLLRPAAQPALKRSGRPGEDQELRLSRR
jgi:hypothetical protein